MRVAPDPSGIGGGVSASRPDGGGSPTESRVAGSAMPRVAATDGLPDLSVRAIPVRSAPEARSAAREIMCPQRPTKLSAARSWRRRASISDMELEERITGVLSTMMMQARDRSIVVSRAPFDAVQFVQRSPPHHSPTPRRRRLNVAGSFAHLDDDLIQRLQTAQTFRIPPRRVGLHMCIRAVTPVAIETASATARSAHPIRADAHSSARTARPLRFSDLRAASHPAALASRPLRPLSDMGYSTSSLAAFSPSARQGTPWL